MKTLCRNLSIVLVLTLAGGVAGGATIQDIIDSSGSVTIGKYTFSDFSVQGTSAGGCAPEAYQIDISFEETADGGVVVNFNGPWSTGTMPWSITTSNIGYKVTVDEGYGVDGSDLAVESSHVEGDGFWSMVGNLYDGPPNDPNSDAFAEYLLQEGLGDDVRAESENFDLINEFYVNTGIFLQTSGEGGLAYMTQFSQTFGGPQPLPEPGTMTLIGLGGLGLLFKYRKRRRV
jgi:hypothetical protein